MKNTISAVIVTLVLAGIAVAGTYSDWIESVNYIQIQNGLNISGNNLTQVENVNGVNFTSAIISDYDYIIYQKPGSVYDCGTAVATCIISKNGSTQKIDYFGTSFSSIMNSSTSLGGSIKLSKGDYTLDGIIVTGQNTTITGTKEHTKILISSGTNLSGWIQLGANSTLQDVSIDGRGSAGTQVQIIGNNVHIKNNIFYANSNTAGSAAIETGNNTNNFITYNTVFGSGNQGMIVSKGYGNKIMFNSLHVSTNTGGISMYYNASFNDVSYNDIEYDQTGATSIAIYVGHANSFTGSVNDNNVHHNNITNAYQGIFVQRNTSRNILSDNTISAWDSTDSYGISSNHVYSMSILRNNINVTAGGINIDANDSNNTIYVEDNIVNTSSSGIVFHSFGGYNFTNYSISRNKVTSAAKALVGENASYVNIYDNDLIGGTYGAYLGYADLHERTVRLTNNKILGGTKGLFVENEVTNLTLIDNREISSITNNALNTIRRDNDGYAPYNFGINTITPTAYGAGDSYYNTTSQLQYFRNNTMFIPVNVMPICSQTVPNITGSQCLNRTSEPTPNFPQMNIWNGTRWTFLNGTGV